MDLNPIELIGFILLVIILIFGFRKGSKQKYKTTSEKHKPPITHQNKIISEISVKEEIEIISKEKIHAQLGYESETNKLSGKTHQVKDELITYNTKVTADRTQLHQVITPEDELQSQIKFIGYTPSNVFDQKETLSYPYVVMPKPNSVIKFPRKGRAGRKGYKEEDFKKYLVKYFSTHFQIFDDRFILVKSNINPFEPDLTLIDERNGLNLFVDVEIDEPYEGLNDITIRKATHYQKLDINRNNAFRNRGWIVIRFAEIQVHQEPDSCCRFIAEVIQSINSDFNIPAPLQCPDILEPVKQWSEEEALVWSKLRYREEYLGIENFGIFDVDSILEAIGETELGEEIEEQVNDDELIHREPLPINSKLENIRSAIKSNSFLSFSYEGGSTITKPISATEDILKAYCYLKNEESSFSLDKIDQLAIKQKYFTQRVYYPEHTFSEISNAIHIAIENQKNIRIEYTRISFTQWLLDKESGELIPDHTDAEESIRTVSNIGLSINVLPQEEI